jgi:geranylgeranyl diphosphate synthase type I
METMLKQYAQKIDASMRRLLIEMRRHYGRQEALRPFFDHTQEFILRPGKRIRPILFLLAYQGYTSRRGPADKKLWRSAASLELLHDFMLIHDDVTDNADLRRGKPTLHKLFDQKIRFSDNAKIGPSLAIIAGDIIYAMAIRSFLAIDEDPRRKEKTLARLAETAASTGVGQFIDIVLGHKTLPEIKEKDIYQLYALKTARYTFECPLVMGATLAGASDAELKKLSALGLAAGIAFQIYDDFLDLFASQEIIGKPVLTDLAESKKTLLVFKTYSRLRGPDKSQFLRILEKKEKRQKDLVAFRQLVVSSGAYAQCLTEMNRLQKKAMRLSSTLAIKKEFRLTLEEVIAKLSPSKMPIQL